MQPKHWIQLMIVLAGMVVAALAVQTDRTGTAVTVVGMVLFVIYNWDKR